MNCHSGPSLFVLLSYLAWFSEASLGQSLSITPKSEREVWVEVVAPADVRYVLQGSGDLQEWVDLNDEIWGQFSSGIDHSGSTGRYFRLIPWVPLEPITLVILGDSTVRDFQPEWNMSGWGGGIYGYFNSDVRIVNLGWPCYSSERFIGSEQEAKMFLIKPDFVLVQFGLVDLYGCPEQAVPTTHEEYADNLKAIVASIRDFGGTPILVTPPAPRVFGGTSVFPVLHERSAVMRTVAAELQVHLTDLHQASTDLFNELGPSGSAFIANGDDPYHFSQEGAEIIAGLVVEALPTSLRRYLAPEGD